MSDQQSPMVTDDGLDTGPAPEGMNLDPSVWDAIPSAARATIRAQHAASVETAQELQAIRQQMSTAPQQSAQPAQEPTGSPRSLSDLPGEELDRLGGQVFGRVIDQITAGLDDEQRESWKAINGNAVWGLIDSKVSAAVTAARSEMQNESQRQRADDAAWGALETALPGATQNGTASNQALREHMNSVAADMERAGRSRDAIEAHLADPFNVSQMARVVQAEQLAARGPSTRSGPTVGDERGEGPRATATDRARALHRDGRPKESWDTMLAGHVSRPSRS